MTAGLYNTTIEQGARYDRTITWYDKDGNLVDLRTYTARAHYRNHHADDDIILELTTGNGGIVLGGLLGTIQLLATTAQTTALPAEAFGVWDLEMVDAAGEADRLLEGAFSITPEVTR